MASSAGAAPALPPPFPVIAEADWTIEQPLVGRVIPCRNGKAAIFDCQGVDLLAYLPEQLIGGVEFTGLWGWTDAVSGREFVVAGHKEGTSFLDITDPVNPRYLGVLPYHAGAQPSLWRDVKVYRHYAFIVSDEAGSHGMQIFDLTQLLAPRTAPAVFQETAHYDRVHSVHTIAIDTTTGFAYAVRANGGGETCGGGLHIIDVRSPTAPTFVGCYAETLGGSKANGNIHETQCVVYHGPDRTYREREICLNAAEEALGIVDVTNKAQPKLVGVGRYPNVGYTHQGWLTEDQRYFFLDDEQDELVAGVAAMRSTPTPTPLNALPRIGFPRTIVFDLARLSDPVVVKEFIGTTPSIDHNLYIRDRYVYESNYRAGLRVLDAKDPTHPKEVGYFDTTPLEENMLGMSGSWSNYPYFRQRGVIAVSTEARSPSDAPRKTTKGLFLLRHRAAASGVKSMGTSRR